MNKIRYYRISGVNISIQGEGKYAEAFQKYFMTEEVSEVQKPISLAVIVVDNPKEVEVSASFFSLSGKISFNHSEYCVKKNNFIYSVSNLFSDTDTAVLKLCYTARKTLKNKVGTFLLPNHIGINNSGDEFVDSIMNYEVFWYIFAVILMRQDKIFVHSSMIERNGNALVLAGTGGCGKTSTLLKLMEQKGYKYLGEDFGVLGCDGIAYYTPKKMAIYQSDAKYGNPDVMKALNELPVRERLQWKFLIALGKNPRYRFTPQQLFGDSRIERQGEIRTIVYMSRVSGKNVFRASADQSELCTKIRHATFRELKELAEILNNIRAVGDKSVRKFYPELSQIECQYEHLLKKILSNKTTGMLNVPLKVSPDEIAENIVDEYWRL